MDTIAHRIHVSIKELFWHQPEWEGSVVGYAHNYLARNAWRVGRELDLDDLLQEAYLLFLALRERYETENEAHFMALWKRALHNWVCNLSKNRTRRREIPLGEHDIASEDSELASVDWRLQCSEAPHVVAMLLNAVENRQRRTKMRTGRGRESTNQYLCRLAKVPTTMPLRSIFERWLDSVR